MAKTKKKFEWWRWQSIDAEVEYNLPERVVIYLAWAIAPKKNSRQNFGHVSLPSANYLEWHKRVIDKLKDIEWHFKNIPCAINISTIVWDKVKSDCDNQVASIMDTIVDLGIIEDDNRFIVKDIHVRNIGYAKNCRMTRIEITPYTIGDCEILDDHKGKDLLEYKHYLNGYFIDVVV